MNLYEDEISEAVDTSGGEATVEPVADAEPATEPAVETAPEVEPEEPLTEEPSYNWEEWDGAALDGVPEAFHPGLQRLMALHQQKLDPLTAELEKLRPLQGEMEGLTARLSAYEDGTPDPRVGQLESQLSERTSAYSTLEQKYQQMEQGYRGLEQKYNEMVDAHNERLLADLPDDVRGVLDDPDHGEKVAQMVATLFDNGAQFKDYGSAVRQAASLLGVPMQAQVRPGSAMTPGANGTPGQAGEPLPAADGAGSLEAARKASIAKYLPALAN